MKRPNWAKHWFAIALVYSIRATCDRLLTATVFVDEENKQISAGYNGSVSGSAHCDDEGHKMVDGHCIRTLHSEDNAIFNSGDTNRLKGATAYLVASPCLRCTKSLVYLGVKKIYYLIEFKNLSAGEREFIGGMLKEKKVIMKKVNLDPRRIFLDAILRLESPGGILFQKNA